MILDIPKDLQDRFDQLELELIEMPFGAQFIKHMYSLVIEKEMQLANLTEWKKLMEESEKLLNS